MNFYYEFLKKWGNKVMQKILCIMLWATHIAINTMKNQTTGLTPFEFMFRRELKSKNLKKAKERIEVEMEKTKWRLDECIVRRHSVYKLNDLV